MFNWTSAAESMLMMTVGLGICFAIIALFVILMDIIGVWLAVSIYVAVFIVGFATVDGFVDGR